jgi:hypothetical protein
MYITAYTRVLTGGIIYIMKSLDEEERLYVVDGDRPAHQVGLYVVD